MCLLMTKCAHVMRVDATGAVLSANGIVISPTGIRVGASGAVLGSVGLDINPTLITIGAADHSKVALGFSIAPSIIKVLCAALAASRRSRLKCLRCTCKGQADGVSVTCMHVAISRPVWSPCIRADVRDLFLGLS